MKFAVCLLILALALTPALAATTEAADFPTEFDITFWQTLPFAAFWCYLAAAQFSPVVEWQYVFPLAAAVSAVNAGVHARKTVTSNPK
jgi:hypothetical protein